MGGISPSKRRISVVLKPYSNATKDSGILSAQSRRTSFLAPGEITKEILDGGAFLLERLEPMGMGNTVYVWSLSIHTL
jgi:hypothetical protein